MKNVKQKISQKLKNMKTLLMSIICLNIYSTNAQIIKPKEVAKNKVENRANNKVDGTVDKGLDKIEEGIGNIFKKKEKKAKAGEAENTASSEEGDTKTNNSVKTSTTKTESLALYSKFDFVAGEKIIAYEDFSQTNVGDFPVGWNTNSTAEVVTLDGAGKKWLFMSKDGYFQPEMIKDMPANFTLEFDLFTRYANGNILGYSLQLYEAKNGRKEIGNSFPETNGFIFSWAGCAASAGYKVYENGEMVNENDNLTIKQFDCQGDNNEIPSRVRVSLWRQNDRLRLYINQEKVLDIPHGFNPKAKYNAFKLGGSYMNFAEQENKDEFLISDIRYAVGAPDTRSKLITEGKLVTTGILFKVNESSILPNSYGTLKEIATVLKENPTVKVSIVGHTDSDGDAAANLRLSKERAQAVKGALIKDFGIDASRMQTDGLGAAAPVASNSTSVGKASNRRVEIIKM